MRLRAYDELPKDHETDRALLHLAAFGGTFSRAAIEERQRSGGIAEYVGIFAVEGLRVVGQTYVLRMPYTFPFGTETVTGIAAVAVRPDRARGGVARRILEEIHRREREDGVRFSTLWTNPSWGAHRLYEKLGYRDIHHPPWAVRGAPPPRPRRRRSTGVRPARRTDLDALDRFHDASTAGRLGYVRRNPRVLSTLARIGALNPSTDLLVATERGRVVGYSENRRSARHARCAELLAGSAVVRDRLVSEVERRAYPGAAIAFQGTFVADSAAEFRRRGYAVLPSSWFRLMGARFGRSWSEGEAVRQFGTSDRRFVCLNGDRF